MPSNPKNFNVDNVRVVKIMGGSLSGSRVVQGMVFGRESEGEFCFKSFLGYVWLSNPWGLRAGMVKKATKAKVAVFTSALDIAQTETKGTVLIKNADEMLNFTRGEEKHLEKVPLHLNSTNQSPNSPTQIFKEIADSGVKVIIAGSSIGELALHYLNRFNIAVLKVLSKFELRRLCRVVNATPLARMGAPTPEEAGFVDVYETIEVGGDRVTVLRQLQEGEEGYDGEAAKTRTATIVLRGATSNRLDDLERAVDDGVNVIKSLLKDPRLVPGAGAAELELGKRVEGYGSGLKGLAQHAVKRYAMALEAITRTLAENAMGGAHGNEVLSRLWAKHEEKGGEAWGVDVEVGFLSPLLSPSISHLLFIFKKWQVETDGTLLSTEHKILDSLAAKHWALKLATEAAVSVLSVDSIIMSKPAGGPKVPQQAGNWDED
jgi:T-complex protein 1 subunit theta